MTAFSHYDFYIRIHLYLHIFLFFDTISCIGGTEMAQMTKSITIRVTPDFHKSIKVYLADKGMTIQKYIEELVTKDMEKNKRQGDK